MADNNITGPIPINLGNNNSWSALTELNLSKNNLNGPIPYAFGFLNSLKKLRLYSNSLTGTIPSTFSGLNNINTLRLHLNDLEGCFDSSFSNTLCNKGIPATDIDNGNDFDAGWASFCASGAGECVYTPCHFDDWTALKALYESTGGVDGIWIDNTGWDELELQIPAANCNLGNLFGVTLSNTSGRVICIDLDGVHDCEGGDFDEGNGLEGALPSEMSNLTELTELWLGHNALNGSIPTQLGYLSNLEFLDLSSNQLSNNIPNQLGDLSNLSYLNLSNNDLGGCFQINLQNICNGLSNYNINEGNNFEADWADFCAVGDGACGCHIDDWTALKALYISTNGAGWNFDTNWDQVAPSSPLSDCFLGDLYGIVLNQETGRVTQVNLHNNNLTGELPVDELSKLTYLTELRLYQNSIQGTIPSDITQLDYLTYMSLRNNQIGGHLPVIGPDDLDNLKQLILSNNHLIGSINWSSIQNLNSIEELSLANNQLIGTIPPQLSELQTLKILNLSLNDFSGLIPPEIGNLTNLQQLRLHENNLIGSIPPSLSNLNNLTSLRIADNNLTGCYHVNLQTFCNISDNNDISDGNSFEATWINFCDFDSGECGPPDICHIEDWTALKALYDSTNGDFWDNRTGWGTILSDSPSANCNLENLYGITLDAFGRVVLLELGNNNLDGIIPIEIGNLNKLQYLDLSNNTFVGGIPQEIGNLNFLMTLYLGYSNLSNNIPPQLGNLSILDYLWLAGNQLSGSIPAQLGNASCIKH